MALVVRSCTYVPSGGEPLSEPIPVFSLTQELLSENLATSHSDHFYFFRYNTYSRVPPRQPGRVVLFGETSISGRNPAMTLTIMRRIRFCAGHRLYKHGGKCEHFHGHNYVADFFVTSNSQDSVGRLIDFADLKARCKGWIDQHWDHSFLVSHSDKNAIQALLAVEPCRLFELPYNPTAENMAKYLLEVASPQFMEGSGGRVVRVRIWETEDSYAEAALENSLNRDDFTEQFSAIAD